MELWNLEDGKATFFYNGKKCLALRQKGTEETGTRMYELVSERKDKRGLPLKILRELTLDEAKQRAVRTYTFVDAQQQKLFKSFFYKTSCGDSKFHTEEVSGKEYKPFIECLIEEVKKVGTFITTDKQRRMDGMERAGENYINVELEYEVNVVEGEVESWKIINEKYWRGFCRPKEKIISHYEAEDGGRETDVIQTYWKGSSDKPITEEEKAPLREREIWHIEDNLKYIANRMEDIRGIRRPRAEKYKTVMKALKKILEEMN
jgi:hypothetical protein